MFEVHCQYDFDPSYESAHRLFSQVGICSTKARFNLDSGRWEHVFEAEEFNQAVAIRKLIEASGEFKATIKEK